jgi:CubicO group peptidase (beta-lactamase class C family)
VSDVRPLTARELGLMTGSSPSGDGLVTLSDWQRGPRNRWSYQHMGQLIPSARIGRGDGPILELAPDPFDLEGIRFETQSGKPSTLADLLESSYTDGFIALHRSRVVTEKYFNGMTRHTRHLLQSVSKSITAAVAGALVEAGALDAEGLLTTYVTELSGTSFEGATVRHLLDMTAGTRFSEDYDDPASDVRLYESAAGWRPPQNGELETDLLSYVLTLPNHRPHGELFEYRSILSDLLAIVLERAGGDRFAAAMSRLVWAQVGAEDDAEVTVDRCGNAMTDGGISVTLRDLARFGQLYLQGGCALGRQVVPSSWVADTRYADEACRRTFLASEEAAESMCAPAQQACYPKGHYRNQWWVLDPKWGVMMGSGIFGQYVYVDATANVVLAKLSSLPDPLDLHVAADTLSAFAAVSGRLAQLA